MAPQSKGEDDDPDPATPSAKSSAHEERAARESDSDDEETDEEDEPRLKYVALTKAQGALYRNGDAASAFLVAGDKMVG